MPLNRAQSNLTTNARVTPVGVDDELLSREYLSSWLGVHQDTLARWDREKRGPRSVRVGDLIRYRRGDVNEWLQGSAASKTRKTKRKTA